MVVDQHTLLAFAQAPADRSARNIFGDPHVRPKTLADFAFREARLWPFRKRYPTLVAVDPFRPGNNHDITRLWAWRAGPVSRGSSRRCGPYPLDAHLAAWPFQLNQA